MPSRPLILTIDQGTSSTKCLLVDETGNVVARGSAPVSVNNPKPGWVDQDAGEIAKSVETAVAACLLGQDPKAVLGVGISNQRESLVAWDARSGEPLFPLISWQDRRTTATCEALRTKETEKLASERSGLPLDPMFSAAKAKWLLDTLDPDRKRARAGQIRFGTVDSWLLHRFGGEHLIEAGNASRTQLLDVRKVAWDQDLLRLFDIPVESLPKVVNSVGPFPAVKGLAPLPDGVPILAVMADSHSSLFANGGFHPGTVKATFGTGSSVMGLIKEPGNLANGLCLTIGWSLGSPAFAAEGNILATGATFRWMADLLGVGTDALAQLAAGVDSQGVSLVPAFNGLGAPWWDSQAVGIITGCTMATSRATLARAALESIVHQVADMVEAVDRSVGQVSEIYADGGATKNGELMQLEADLLGRPVLVSRTAELSALGVAHLAGTRTGFWTLESLKNLARDRARFDSTWPKERRARARATWLSAVRRARGLPPNG